MAGIGLGRVGGDDAGADIGALGVIGWGTVKGVCSCCKKKTELDKTCGNVNIWQTSVAIGVLLDVVRLTSVKR